MIHRCPHDTSRDQSGGDRLDGVDLEGTWGVEMFVGELWKKMKWKIRVSYEMFFEEDAK